MEVEVEVEVGDEVVGDVAEAESGRRRRRQRHDDDGDELRDTHST